MAIQEDINKEEMDSLSDLGRRTRRTQ